MTTTVKTKLLWYMPKEEKDVTRYPDDTEDDIQHSTRYNHIYQAIVEVPYARFLLVDVGGTHRSFQMSHVDNDGFHVYWERHGFAGVAIVNDPVVTEKLQAGTKLQ